MVKGTDMIPVWQQTKNNIYHYLPKKEMELTKRIILIPKF
jgi:hypothetical protein